MGAFAARNRLMIPSLTRLVSGKKREREKRRRKEICMFLPPAKQHEVKVGEVTGEVEEGGGGRNPLEFQIYRSVVS